MQQVRLRPHGPRALLVGLLTVAVLGAGCTADPAPPPEADAPAPTTSAVPASELPDEALLAVDQLGTGFNPHLLADLSPVTTLVSGLVLPSVFTPAADGGRVLDTDVAVSAVASADTGSEVPFTLTYRIRDDAQWSDGVPVTAEDFQYLAEQMSTQPGVVNPAGYELVQDVASADGGKTVTVTLDQPYPAWRELFAHLLPSHLLRNAPGGFATALDDGLVASAGPFALTSVDFDRGELRLDRNDRFWAAPATLDALVLRRDGTAGQLAEALGSNDAQLALVHADLATAAQISAVPDLLTADVAQPIVWQVALDTTDPRLAEPQVRRALLGMLDADVLTVVGTGLPVLQAERVRAQLLAPSEAGYAATAPDPLSAEAAAQSLLDAGYRRTSGRWERDGTALDLVVGADADDAVGSAIAQAAADQLTSAGAPAGVALLPSEELYGAALDDGDVDLVVGPVAAGLDPATTLTSRFGCRPQVELTAAAPRPGQPSDSSGSSAGGRGANVSGLCDAELDVTARAVLAGTESLAVVADEVEQRLWQLAAVLPLYQDETLLAVRPELVGVTAEGPLLAGPGADATTWRRSDR